MSVEILETLHADLQSTRDQNEAAFVNFARAIAAGETPDAAAVGECLRSLRLEISDLSACVSLIKRRSAWRAEIDAGATADAAERDARAAIASADSELEAARLRHQTATAGHWAAIQVAAATKATAGEAKRQLADLKNVVDPAARRQLQSCRSSIEQHSGRLRQLGSSSWAEVEVSRIRTLLSRERQVEASLLAELINS
jgi:hypothetical protein